ncbi:uncharacterized protein [Lepeophtheirus salmonis]|uniref:Glycerophosphocholine acyltransferase 1 n=1 Tax=Lepeophtheirus salmonis TaxID=72036 RepID=A0A0K2U9V9_LEPSM|nr:glycerophosphocholine acyltransferase 1-like [Lepeophtheirus salmonis]
MESSVIDEDYLQSSGFPDIQNLIDQLKNGLQDKSSKLFHSLKGKAFHLVSGNNKIFQYKVDLDGHITLVRRFKSLNRHGNVENLFKDVPAKAQRQFRAAVTGDPNKRIRDHLKETPQVKMLDKVSFTLGVLIICLTQWVIHRMPSVFPYYFSGLLSFLFVSRYMSYKKEKYHMFLLDFCYFLNISTMIQALFFPLSETWFKINYVLSHGPILMAIVVWQNSLVFHSIDKVTSFFLHAFAPVYCHLTRWSLINPDFLPSSLNFCTAFVYPLLTYLLWQALYVFLIEVSPLSRTLANDSELLTSYRYLSRDKKNSLNQLVAYLCAKWKIELPTTESGDIDPDAYRMKAVFFAAQFVYTFITLLYVWIVYTSYVLNCTYILIIFIWGTWNGASYYIEVFSKRYNLKFEVKEYEESVVYECDDGDSDEEFVEATEILNNEISSLSEYKDDVRIVDVNYDPNLSFKLSNNKDKFLSFNELRFEYPQLAITFLMSFPKEGDRTIFKEDENKKDI